MSNGHITPVKAADLAAETPVYIRFLSQHGLPTDNVIAPDGERAIIATNIPMYLDSLDEQSKRDARYLAKFVGAAAVGLFDAALNYIWNEVVLTLRKKVVIYGIDLFYDAAVGGRSRQDYKDDRDLDGIKDTVLLDTCCKLEIISDIVFQKLDHILTMRNSVAASHPTAAQIGGYELMGWLQTCVKEVIEDRLSDSAIRVGSFITNLKSLSAVIDPQAATRIQGELKNLSLAHVDNLLITTFGIYVSDKSDQILRKNVSLVSPSIWGLSSERAKRRIGSMIDGYQTNLDAPKHHLGSEFLEHVNGKMYLPTSTRIAELLDLSAKLHDAHHAFDNYYHEPPIMRSILSLCQKSSDIPAEVRPQLIRTVLQCRLGRGLSYRDGVSPEGRILYDKFFGILDEDGAIDLINALFEPVMLSKLQNSTRQIQLGQVLAIVKPLIISDRLSEAYSLLMQDIRKVKSTLESTEFNQLMSAYA